MAVQNFFDLLTKWNLRERSDPLENRLTAVFVAVADRYPELHQPLADLAGVTLPGDAQGRVSMHPSVWRGPQYVGAVDAELLTADAVVWWEAKLYSRLSGVDQLTKYLQGMPARSQQALVLLAPASRRREFEPELARSAKLRFVSWEQVLGVIQAAREVIPDDSRLLTDALNFFDDHGFRPTQMLDAELVQTLKRYSEAEAALEALLDAVAVQTDGKYGQPQGVSTYERRQYKPAGNRRRTTGWGETARLEWEFEWETTRLWAGLMYDGTRYGKPAFKAWLAGLATKGWEDEPGSRGLRYVGRYRDLGEFVQGTTAQQAERVAGWIDKIFEEVIDTRP